MIKDVLLSEPENTSLLLQLADLYILDNQISKAIACFQKVDILEPDNIRVKKKLALSFAATGKQKEAIEALEKIVHEEPTNTRIYSYLGELYEKEGEHDKAILNFKLATQGEILDPTAYLRLSLLELEEDPQAAIHTLLEGLEKMPGNIRMTETLAYLYLYEEQFEDACRYFGITENAVTKGRGSFSTPSFYFNYALASQHAGTTEETVRLLTQAISQDPAYLDSYIQYLIKSEGEEQLASGKIALIALLDGLPEQAIPIHTYLGLLYNFTQDYKDAITHFEHVEAMDAENPAQVENARNALFLFWYGSACERDGQIERAVELFRSCIRVNPEYAEAYNYLAYMWAERKENLDEALEFVDKALSLRPQSGAFLDTSGWIYYQQEQYDKALEQILKALELLPDDPTIVDHLGDTLAKLGKEKEALPHWKRAYQLDPENKELSSKLEAYGIVIEDLLPPSPSETQEEPIHTLPPITQE